MFNVPSFQTHRLSNGRILLLRHEVVGEFDAEEASRLEKARLLYHANTKGRFDLFDWDCRRVAEVIRCFAKNTFHHSDVVIWAAYVGVASTEKKVSNLLGSLKRRKPPVIELTGSQGQGARWRIDRKAIEKFLQ